MSVQRVKVKFMKWKYNAVAETEDQEEPMSQPLIINTTAASSGGGVTRVVENNVLLLRRYYRIKRFRVKYCAL